MLKYRVQSLLTNDALHACDCTPYCNCSEIATVFVNVNPLLSRGMSRLHCGGPDWSIPASYICLLAALNCTCINFTSHDVALTGHGWLTPRKSNGFTFTKTVAISEQLQWGCNRMHTSVIECESVIFSRNEPCE